MSNKLNEINIKNRTYYFLDDMINIKTIDPNKIKIDEKSNKTYHLPQWIRDGQRPQLRNISSVNPLYLIINKIYGYIEESNGNEHLSLVLTDSSFYRRKQRHAKKYEELWNNIRDLIRSISNNSFRPFTSIDHLPLKKTLELYNMIIVVRSLFHFWYMSKDEAINVMKNFDLKGKSGTL